MEYSFFGIYTTYFALDRGIYHFFKMEYIHNFGNEVYTIWDGIYTTFEDEVYYRSIEVYATPRSIYMFFVK
jgi:hypothetical protein